MRWLFDVLNVIDVKSFLELPKVHLFELTIKDDYHNAKRILTIEEIISTFSLLNKLRFVQTADLIFFSKY